MPAGWPYFAWIDASETIFGPEHLRWDEQVYSFTLAQEEGDPATLTVVVRRPRNDDGDPIGLLGPGRKIWAWFALDCGPALMKFRGRLVGIPTSLFEDLVTLEFVAKPVDVVAQKEALAATLRVLPFYDEAVIEPSRRTDPDVVLEGYTKIWHFDPVSHVVSVSDEVSGEDGQVNFLCANGDILYEGLGLTLTTGPLARVDVNAEYTWTQHAEGTTDLTGYLLSHWPDAVNGIIRSYSLTAADWPKVGAGIGDGWTVADASATDYYDHKVITETRGGSVTVLNSDGETTGSATWTESVSKIAWGGGVYMGQTNIRGSTNISYDVDGSATGFSTSRSWTDALLVYQQFKPTLVARYKADRNYTERIHFSLIADVQPILTDPEDGEALQLDNIRSVNLTEELIIGDAARRSFITTERGNRSLEYLIVLARAHLMKRARVVEISFVPKLERMPEVTLRKNAFVAEPRIGEATGKIIGYSVALDGSDGQIKCEVKIGCMIGRGGTIASAAGNPTYCTIDYVGADYQVFINRVLSFLVDSSVGYEPPTGEPNDDGIDFSYGLSAEDAIEEGLGVVYGAAAQEEQLSQSQWGNGAVMVPTANVGDGAEDQAQQDYFRDYLKRLEMKATFKLRPVTGQEFTTDYEIQLTDLKIPTGYNLEAV